MNCLEAQQRLSAYHDGELPPEEAASVASHLANCSSCTGELDWFAQLSGLSRRLSDPPTPSDLWNDLQSKLHAAAHPVAVRGRFAWNRVPGRFMAVAATILVAVGIGAFAYNAWFADAEQHHLAMNFAGYLQDFSQKPDSAQQILLANYNGRSINLSDAADALGYEPLAASGLPPGYSIESAYLLDMPCCTCAQVICKNRQGQSIAIFEHDIDQPVWFGDRPKEQCMCADVPTSVTHVGDRLAATWKEGKRHVTLIGVTNLDEVAEFVASFKSRATARSG